MNNSKWKSNTLVRLDKFVKSYSKYQIYKFKIKKLIYMIQLIDSLAERGCEDCYNYQMSIDRMVDQLRTNQITKEYHHLYHLVKNHLITDHHFIQSWVSFFLLSFISIVGCAFASKMLYHQVEMGIWIGIIVGCLLGVVQELKIKKLGRSI